MAPKKLSRNAPCPCGSGKKYKDCCYSKGFDWLEDHEDGPQEAGRDDLFFKDLPPIEHVEHELAQAMKKAGIDPAAIYAFEKTGLIVSEDNVHLIPEKGLAEWRAAVEEYNAQHKKPHEPAGGPEPSDL